MHDPTRTPSIDDTASARPRRARRSHWPRTRVAALAALPILGASASVVAGPQTPTADLQVQLVGPTVADINLPATYTVTVTNRGANTSAAITATIGFPVTSTSPQVYLLGAATSSDPRCSMTGRTMTCSLVGLRKGWSTSFFFKYTAPVAAKPLTVSASATSATADPVSGNNSASVLPNLRYPARAIGGGSATVRGCTGTTLTAFEECERFPGSIWSHVLQFFPQGGITYAVPGYSGTWSQNAARTSLRMELYVDQGQGPVKTGEFNGWAINGKNCFQGLTTFVQNTNYVSPYEVCF